jgi:hypothetical protein
MKLTATSKKIAWAALASTLAFTGCTDDDSSSSQTKLQDHSITPALIKKMPGFENLEVFSLISSDDQIEASPYFRFGGSADGSGWLKNDDGNIVALVNNEDNFSVARLTFDKNTLKPVKGEYILNSDGGQWRLCSATLATPGIHGFGPLYLTCGESGVESRTHGIQPLEKALTPGISRELAGLGRWSAENAVPLPKDAYTGKTIILVGDDDSNADGGQLAMYMSTTGDLDNGSLYMLKRTDNVQQEMDIKVGQNVSIEFVKIENHKALKGSEINAKVNELKAVKFGRVEDIDYRKGNASNHREVYFNVTGQDASGFNADKSRSKYGRTYKIVLDQNDPLKGTLSVVMDGDDASRTEGEFQNVDNICVTDNFVYVQEDSNGYGNAKGTEHDAYIWQYTIATGEVKKVFELDHRRTAPDAATYNVGGNSDFGDWEYGSMVDISDLVRVPNTFAICIQPHTWRGDKYKGVDGGSLRRGENQASQIIIVRGIQK